jgi:putative ATPase
MSQEELFGKGTHVPPQAMPIENQIMNGEAETNPLHCAPLAARMRPQSLDEYVGQQHILGPGALLRRSIEADRVQSLILYGPPGTGKTTLAQIIARASKSRFERLSGVESNVSDMRIVLKGASNRLANTGQSTLLFVDEIHRFNKSQQDILLPDVESGAVKLIGATTHNPCFFVNAPLVSRSQIFELQPLEREDLIGLIRRAIGDEERGLGGRRIRITDEAVDHIVKTADGDGRKALSSLEIAALTTGVSKSGEIFIDLKVAEECIQKKAVIYDRDGDAHYDTISAFIKSMRGSDPDAALYWLAKMIHAGEDPRFITRRLLICAAEDVGLADPMALVLASSAHQAAEFVGWPEARIPIAEATIYIATAFKSNSAMTAIDAALEDVKKNPTLPVPAHLRDGHYRGAEALGRGVGYQNNHDFPGEFVKQDYLGAERRYYVPGEQGVERKIRDRLQFWRDQSGKKENDGPKGD